MAILNSLLVNGAARFLNTIYAKDLDVSAGIYIDGDKALRKTTDSWLYVNGDNFFTKGVYFGNKIARTDGTLQVGNNGSDFSVSHSGLTCTVASSFSGTASFTGATSFSGSTTFTGDITAKNVLVQDTLRAAHYDLETITVMGNNSILYVAPSIKFDTAPTVTISKSGSNLTITLVHSSITNSTIAGVAWLKGSKVKISGVFGGVVSGTMTGTLDNDVNSTSNTMKMTVSGGNAANIASCTATTTDMSGINVMMYEKAASSGSSTLYPIGIYLTSLGGTNRRTYIDIYSGTSNTTRVRLGDLADLTDDAYKIGTVSPSGWGLYTDNGFFKGTIYSTAGVIGGWTIGSTAIFNGTSTKSSTDEGTYLGTDAIRNYKNGNQYVHIEDGKITAKAVDISGAIYATSGNFGTGTTKISIGDGAIFYGVESLTDTAHDGFFLGSTGLTLGKGIFKVTNAGALTASNITLGTSTSNNIQLGTANFTRTINGTSRTDLRFAISDKFAVSNAGYLYAYSGLIGGINIGTSDIHSGSHTAYNTNATGFYLGSDGKFGIGNNSSYIRYDGSNLTMNVTSLSIGGTAAATTSDVTAVSDKVNQMSETIFGTQTTGTYDWTGTSTTISALTDGMAIMYWLPYTCAGTQVTASYTNVTTGASVDTTGAALNLTLSNGTTTGNIPIWYSGVSRLKAQYPGGNVIRLTYRDNVTFTQGSGTSATTYTATGWWADANNEGSNTYDRRYHNGAIKAATAITSQHVICGTSAGYKNIGANIAFDLSYPLLYSPNAIGANSTRKDCYEAMPDVNFSKSGTIQSGAAYKMLYLKGSVSGSTFTIASSNFMTTAIPTSADNMYYIPLGIMTSATVGYFVTSNRLYGFVNDSFQAIDTAAQELATTANTNATNAAKTATNYLYYDSANGLVVNQENITAASSVANLTKGNVRITADGMDIYKGQTKVASYGETATIGITGAGKVWNELSSTGFDIISGTSSTNSQSVFYAGVTKDTDYVLSSNVVVNNVTSFSSKTAVSGWDSKLYAYRYTISSGYTGSKLLVLELIMTSGTVVPGEAINSEPTTSQYYDKYESGDANTNLFYYRVINDTTVDIYFGDGFNDNRPITYWYKYLHATFIIPANSSSSTRYTPYISLGSRYKDSNSISVIGGRSISAGTDLAVQGYGSLSIGRYNKVYRDASFVGGQNSIANGTNSIIFGENLEGLSKNIAIFGQYNNPDSTDLLEIGNGTSDERSNAFSVSSTGVVKADKFVSTYEYGSTNRTITLDGTARYTRGFIPEYFGNNSPELTFGLGLVTYGGLKYKSATVEDDPYQAITPDLISWGLEVGSGETIADHTATILLEEGGIYELTTYEYNKTSYAFRGQHMYLITAPSGTKYGANEAAKRSNIVTTSSTGVTVTQPTTSSHFSDYSGYPFITIAPSSTAYHVDFVLSAKKPSMIVPESYGVG